MQAERVKYNTYKTCAIGKESVKEGWLIKKDKDGDGKIDSEMFICEECYQKKYAPYVPTNPPPIRTSNYDFSERITFTIIYAIAQIALVIVLGLVNAEWYLLAGELVFGIAYIWGNSFFVFDYDDNEWHWVLERILLGVVALISGLILNYNIIALILSLIILIVILSLPSDLYFDDSKTYAILLGFTLCNIATIVLSRIVLPIVYENNIWNALWFVAIEMFINCLFAYFIGLIDEDLDELFIFFSILNGLNILVLNSIVIFSVEIGVEHVGVFLLHIVAAFFAYLLSFSGALYVAGELY